MTYVDFDICHRMAFLQKFVYRDLDLLSGGHTFEMLISLKQSRRKMHGTTFVDCDIYYWGTTLQILCFVTLTYFQKVKNLKH